MTHEIQDHVLNIYVKRGDLIISSILCDEMKKFFIVILIKYVNNATTIARYSIEQIIVNIVVVVAIRVALLFSLSLATRSLFKFLSQLIDFFKRFFS
jgi:hypothetical protein